MTSHPSNQSHVRKYASYSTWKKKYRDTEGGHFCAVAVNPATGQRSSTNTSGLDQSGCFCSWVARCRGAATMLMLASMWASNAMLPASITQHLIIEPSHSSSFFGYSFNQQCYVLPPPRRLWLHSFFYVFIWQCINSAMDTPALHSTAGSFWVMEMFGNDDVDTTDCLLIGSSGSRHSVPPMTRCPSGNKQPAVASGTRTQHG